MPGVKSLEAAECYARAQNQFWKKMGRLLFFAPSLANKKRVKTLLDNKVGLWDVVKSCRRQGSLDSNIKHVVFNDIHRLLSGYKEIMAILCNGQKAYQLLTKHFKDNNTPVVVLPSASPVYVKPFEWKLTKWQVI